jgi:hypothetical protein
MTAARLRQVSSWTTPLLVAVIVMLTLVLSPGEGGSLSHLVPATVPVVGDRTGFDACVGGIPCRDGHALAFVALGMSLTVQLIVGHRGRRVLLGMAVVVAAVVLLATASELGQGLTGRDAALDDWVADVGGGLLGMLLGLAISGLLALRS